VSIKNKFATAVATAGLLAGLFGSAFVPVANGAGRASTTVSPKASLTVLSPEADLDDATAGGTAVGFLSADSDIAAAGDAVAMKVEINSAGNANITVADLKAVSSNDEIQVAWLYTDAGANGVDCSDMDSADSDGVGADLALDNFSDSDEITSGPDEAAGVFWLCFAAAEDDTSAVSTVTISAQASAKAATEGYVLLKTLTVTAIGPVDSIALSITDGYKYVAEENTALTSWLTIKCYDERDVLINDKTASISEANSCGTVTEDSANPKNNADAAIGFITTGTVAADTAAANLGALQFWSLDAQTCNTEAGDTDLTDEGTSYSLKVAIGTVKSNAITITCTDVSATAIVTKVTGEAASGDQVYDDGSAGDNEFEFLGTVTDEDGRPLGDGAAAADFVWTIDGSTEAIDTWVDAGPVVAVGGEVRLGELDNTDGAGAANPDFGRLGRHTMTLSAADSDLGATTDVAKDFEVVYTAVGADDTEISSTRNAAKTRAVITADMTEDNAFERIEFFVELSNGTVKTFVRRANAEGVATLVQVRRNTTVYVYADVEDGGGSTTDVLKVVFK
jgi:hypothetical protein